VVGDGAIVMSSVGGAERKKKIRQIDLCLVGSLEGGRVWLGPGAGRWVPGLGRRWF
jgi:hypothetical protein